jgi:hypothetical protein
MARPSASERRQMMPKVEMWTAGAAADAAVTAELSENEMVGGGANAVHGKSMAMHASYRSQKVGELGTASRAAFAVAVLAGA